MKKLLLLSLLILYFIPMHAQWAIGLGGGATANSPSGSPQYAYDLRTKSAAGWFSGVTGRYTINPWLAVRGDLLYMTRNYKQQRGPMFGREWGFTQRNGYLELPLMASFSFGPSRLHGFLNVGVAFGVWLTQHRSGYELSLSPTENSEFQEPEKYSGNVPFDSRRDQRFDLSPLLGAGIGCQFAPHWEVMAEARFYYSIISFSKKYQGLSVPRYNSTLTFGLTLLHTLPL